MTRNANTPAGTAPSGKRRAGKVAHTHPVRAVGASKLVQLVTLLSRPDGATLAELVEATGWKSHSVRGALAGALKRKGHAVTSEKLEGERRYRIGSRA